MTRTIAIPGDLLLGFWLTLSLFWDILCLGTCAYVVFWKWHSGWWFALAIPLSFSETLFKVLKKRFEIEDEETEDEEIE